MSMMIIMLLLRAWIVEMRATANKDESEDDSMQHETPKLKARDLADDLLRQPAPWRLVADPPLNLRYAMRHDSVAWVIHDEEGRREWMPYTAGRRKPGVEEESDFDGDRDD